MKGKARSPTKTKGERSAIDVVLLALQCSQRIGQWLVLLSAVHVLSTVIAVMVVEPDAAEVLRSILDGCCDKYYRWGVLAYFGKAAAENVLKITQNAKSSSSYMKLVEKTDDSDGNG